MTSKKGFVAINFFIVLIVLFLFGIITFISYQVFTPLNEDIQNDLEMNNESKAISDDLYSRFPATLDGAYATILGLLYVVLLVITWFSNDHPVFMAIVVILMLFAIIVAIPLSNAFEEFAGDEDLTVTQGKFPIITFSQSHTVELVIAVMISILLVMGLRYRS